MKKFLPILLLILWTSFVRAQEDRIQGIENNLEVLAVDNPEFSEKLKLEVNVNKVTLPNFLIAVSKVHGLNLSVAHDISDITVVNNFTNVTVADLLIFLCKEYSLTIDFTGSILSIKRFIPPTPVPEEKIVQVDYSPSNELISIDVNNEPLDKVFRRIMEVSGRNLLYANDLKSRTINGYLNQVPFDKAMEKLADINGLAHSKSRDGFYLFSAMEVEQGQGKHLRGLRSGMNYEVLDTINKILNVDFNKTSIAQIIDALSFDLKLDVYTATPLEEAGSVTFNAKSIYFDDLLAHIFESGELGMDMMATSLVQQNQGGRQRP
ncbi:MAG: hypothetical protein AAGC45_15020, partial [Bacteroidota bacterium]